MYSTKKIKHTIFALMSALAIMSSSVLFGADDDTSVHGILLMKNLVINDIRTAVKKGSAKPITKDNLNFRIDGDPFINPTSYLGGESFDNPLSVGTQFSLLINDQPPIATFVPVKVPADLTDKGLQYQSDGKLAQIKINDRDALVKTVWFVNTQTIGIKFYRVIEIQTITIDDGY